MRQGPWSHEGYPAVLALVEERAGLAPPSCPASAEEGISRAMARAGVSDFDEYRARITSDSAAMDDLLTELTIGETYFFRTPEHFEFLRRVVLPALRERHGPDYTVKMWSAACSSGEEPYSMAALLMSEGWGEHMAVYATDVSRASLARARRGHYGEWSMRGPWAERMRVHLRPEGRQYVLSPEVKQRVRFSYLNLALDTWPSPDSGIWKLDVVFCRNVLIYFNGSTIEAVARRLHASLGEGGVLFTGPSDPPLGGLAPLEPVLTEWGVFYRRLPPGTTVAVPDASPFGDRGRMTVPPSGGGHPAHSGEGGVGTAPGGSARTETGASGSTTRFPGGGAASPSGGRAGAPGSGPSGAATGIGTSGFAPGSGAATGSGAPGFAPGSGTTTGTPGFPPGPGTSGTTPGRGSGSTSAGTAGTTHGRGTGPTSAGTAGAAHGSNVGVSGFAPGAGTPGAIQGTGSPSPRAPSPSELSAARRALERGDWREAALRMGALDSDPDTATAAVRAIANLDAQAAVYASAEAASRHPLVPDLRYLEALLLLGQGRLPDAERSVRQALYLEPTLAVAWLVLGRVLRRLGDTPGALKALREAEALCEALPPDAPLPLAEGEHARDLARAARDERIRLENPLTEGKAP
ncbi:chemotaxis protein CheR [Myxococcus llanfairpwllgwyngyllgogerychwyrndrobwllllantysiliogogogochensis]|uniref:Chemotaxis protein CheR n=1 Tax=Myxococcus llanfairpwllgwyngyllgogerychwyrndrobwllllantysiliogogogochensis TaxID=2590453 RepID=A0A540WXS7_9BACT|nr:CheR family methyltransferase [Myxococcus llanfairpwllgwyngyllgogerychwyrndrobwllllantysiliogogogochensis]TQF13807.1 chemotaxis protein CheR [Myxococcus llanfairpwllgwyngyllgogerychwyrndrobwllllantysiliogogogochensis]